MKKIIILIFLLVFFTGCDASNHRHSYLNGDFCSCGELNPNHVHKYLNYECSCGEKEAISKNKTEAQEKAEYFLKSIDIGTVIENVLVEYIDNDFEIFSTSANNIKEADLKDSTYSLFGYGTSLSIESSNESVLKPCWIKTKERVYKYDEDDNTKVTDVEYLDTYKYIFRVNQTEEDNLIDVTFKVSAPYYLDNTIQHVTLEKTYKIMIVKEKENVKNITIEKLLKYSVIEKGQVLSGRSPYFKVTGMVTEQLFGDGYAAHSFVMMDDSGNSIYVYGPNDKVNIGDKVEVTGKLVIVNNSVRINMFSDVKIIGHETKIEDPEKISIDDWYEDFPNGLEIHTISGKRIKIEGTLIKEELDGNISYLIKSNESENYLRINNKSYTAFEQSLLDKLVDTSCEFVVSVIYYQEDSWQVILNNFEYFPVKK